MTAPFPSEADSLAAARAAARAAAVAAAAAASAAAAGAVQHHPDDTLIRPEHNHRLDIVTAKPTHMDDHIVAVDPDSVVAAAADPHAHHSDIERRKSHHAHEVADSDGVPVANGEPESDSVPLHIPVSVAPDHHHPLDPHVDEVAITTADLLPAPTNTPIPPPAPVMQPLHSPAKKKRKTYSTEEERRKARILKNRRTAEESRQRRMKRMKELEEYAARASAREKELQDEVRIAKEQLQQVTDSLRNIIEEKNAEIAQKDAEIQRLQEKLPIK